MSVLKDEKSNIFLSNISAIKNHDKGQELDFEFSNNRRHTIVFYPTESRDQIALKLYIFGQNILHDPKLL